MSEFTETPTTPLSPTEISSVISQATSVQTHHDKDPHQHRPQHSHQHDFRHPQQHYPEEFEDVRKLEKQILQCEHDQRHQEELEQRKYHGGRKDPEDAEADRHRVPRPGHRHHTSSPSQLLHHDGDEEKSKPHPNPIDNDIATEITSHSKSPDHAQHHKLHGEGRHKDKDDHHHPHRNDHGHDQQHQEHHEQHLQPPKKPPIDDETLIQDVKEFLHVHAKDIPHPETNTTTTSDILEENHPHHPHHSHHPQHEKTKKEIIDEIVEKEYEKELKEQLPANATPTDRKPRVIHARYKEAHTFHRHGKFHYQVPPGFVSHQETEMKEPGGEWIVFHIPSRCHVGDELIIEY